MDIVLVADTSKMHVILLFPNSLTSSSSSFTLKVISNTQTAYGGVMLLFNWQQ